MTDRLTINRLFISSSSLSLSHSLTLSLTLSRSLSLSHPLSLTLSLSLSLCALQKLKGSPSQSAAGLTGVESDVAAILPHSVAIPIEADPRAIDIAKRHRLHLGLPRAKPLGAQDGSQQAAGPRLMIRPFDDVDDSVNFDLIVVMDRFDHAEVLKEVAAYDNIFPGGFYALKVRRLAGFKVCW